MTGRVGLGLLLTLVLLPALALGATEEAKLQARRHFEHGRALYQQARYEDAINEFQAAYQLVPHPAVLFNLAQCEEKLGRTAEALKYYQQYVAANPNAPDAGRVHTIIANLETRLKETALQPLTINSAPQGAAVSLDGAPVGRSPITEQVKAGTHAVDLTLRGHQRTHRDVETTYDRPTEIDVILPPLAAGEPEVAESGPSGEVGGHAHGFFTPMRIGGLAALAVGTGCLIGAGIVGGGAAADAATLSNGTLRTYTANQALVASAQSKSTTSNVLYAVGGTAVAVAASLFVLEGRF